MAEPDGLRIGGIRIDVRHPAEGNGDPVAACRLAVRLGMQAATEAKARSRPRSIRGGGAPRPAAEIDVAMPGADAAWQSPIQFACRCRRGRRVHDADGSEATLGALVRTRELGTAHLNTRDVLSGYPRSNPAA